VERVQRFGEGHDATTYELPGWAEECKSYVNAGLTLQEAETCALVTRAASAILSLPELHPAEQGEAVALIHHLQARLFMRPAYRRYVSEPEPASDPMQGRHPDERRTY